MTAESAKIVDFQAYREARRKAPFQCSPLRSLDLLPGMASLWTYAQ